MNSDETDIARAIMDGSDEAIDKGIGKTMLRYAVQRKIFCPYNDNVVLDQKKAVLVDGSKYDGQVIVMCDYCYDKIIAKFKAELPGIKTPEAGFEKLFGHKVEIFDGRQLFKR